MARKTNIQNAFSPAVARTTPLGSAGYDNARENVDPHVKTKVINLKEFVQNGISYDFATYLANHPHQNVKTTASPSFVDGYFSGNVGIGTATPDKALHVVGQVKVKSTGTSFGQGGFYFEQSADTSRWEILPAYGTLYWGYNGSTEMQLTASGLTVPSGFMTAAVVNGTRLRSGQLQMVTNNLHERTTNGVGTLNLNMIGYGEGTTQFRNTKIGNGKSTQIALFEGSSQKLILEGDLEMTGNSVINADGILSLTSDSYISLDGGVNKHLYFNGDNNFLWRDSGDSYAPRMTLVSSTGNLGIGTTTPAGALDVTSTTQGLIVPRMTTAQVAALTAVNGMIVYDLTLNKFQFYENGAWVSGSGLV